MDAAGSTASRTAGQPRIDSGNSTTAWNFVARFAFDWLGFDVGRPRGHRDANHPSATGYRQRP